MNFNKSRGRVKELPPPDVRSQQKLSEVAEAPRSGGSSKEWRKLDQVGEKEKVPLKVFKNEFQEKKFKKSTPYVLEKMFKKEMKKSKKERHNLKTSTNVHLQNDCCVALQYLRAKPIQASATFSMAEMVAEAHLACTTTSVLLGPKPLSFENLHL